MDHCREAYIRGRNDEAQILLNWLHQNIDAAKSDAHALGVEKSIVVAILDVVLRVVEDPSVTPALPKPQAVGTLEVQS